MPLLKSIPITDGLLAIWQIDESSDELLSRLGNPDSAKTFFQTIRHEKRRIEWLATRALLSEMIGADYDISYLETGKPIINHSVYKHLSISHSRDYIAVCLHQNRSVGIDIESAVRNFTSIEKKYLTAQELMHVDGNPILQCLYWCAKEAVFKLVEEDGIDFRKQIQISAFDMNSASFDAVFISGDQQRTYRLHYSIFDQHCLVWVCDNMTINFY